ncbi:Imm49 family immunity protein [Streptomyces sp. NPDC090046]|uniref:Imm49 family immunity protein n=1 Tax=Streptomyces sp. NPDC090046 TaxID=3365928 RepID=UPI00382D5B51
MDRRSGQEERHLVTTGPKPYLTADTWLDAFYLAVICREAARLDMLAPVPVSLLRAIYGVADEYADARVGTLQSFRRRRDDLPTRSVRPVDVITPAHSARRRRPSTATRRSGHEKAPGHGE